MSKLLTERVATPFAGTRVDREAGTIDGVLICGFTSHNGRTYTREMFKRDHVKYEGKPVNTDHSTRPEGATVDRRIGWFSDVKLDADGRPRGRLNLLLAHPLTPRVLEAAERNPSLYGFSHVVRAEPGKRGRDGREVIENIEEVVSVDLVAQPATTSGIFEGKSVPGTLKAFVEALVRHPKTTTKQVVPLKQLCEMDGLDSGMAMDAVPPADDADAGDHEAAIDTAFESAGHAVWSAFTRGEIEFPEMKKKLVELAKGHGKVKENGPADSGDDGDDTGDTDDDDNPFTPESKQISLGVIWEECIAADYTPSEPVRKVLALIPDAAERAAFITEQRKLIADSKAQKPQSAARRPGGNVVRESAPADAKEFAASIRE